MTVDSSVENLPAPKMGESTRSQTGSMTFFSADSGIGAALASALRADTRPCSYDDYREMLKDPTIALCRAVCFSTLKSADWTIEADDEVDDDTVQFVQDQIEPLRSRFMDDLLRALDYGWQGFEKVFEIVDGQFVLDCLKSLKVDNTEIMVDKTGKFAGLKQGDVILGPEKCFLFSYDVSDGQLHGRSRLENLRKGAWIPWNDANQKNAAYLRKGAAVTPICRYPQGQEMDATGKVVDNSILAQQGLRSLATCAGIAIPFSMPAWAEQILNSASSVNMESMCSWSYSFLEAKSGHGAEFIQNLQYYDVLKVRGYLLPERSILESQSGSRADSESHGDWVVQIHEQLLAYILECVNRDIVNQLLVLNYGPDSKGTVRIVSGPLRDDDTQFLRDVLKQVFAANPDLFVASVDLDGAYDAVGLMKSKEVLSDTELPMLTKDTPDPNAPTDPNAPPTPKPPVPGDPAKPPSKPKGYERPVAASRSKVVRKPKQERTAAEMLTRLYVDMRR